MILFIPLINSSVSTWDYDLIKLSDGMALRAVCNFQETFFGQPVYVMLKFSQQGSFFQLMLNKSMNIWVFVMLTSLRFI